MKRRTLLELLPVGGLAAMAQTDPAARRQELYGLLGTLPPRDRPIHARMLGAEERPGYILERFMLDVNGAEPAPAYFVRPHNAHKRIPAVLFNHWHAGEYQLGKDDLVRPKFDLPSWAEALTAAGYCALCLDMWCFGGRATRTEMDTFKLMLWNGQVLWGAMVYDTLRGLDYLVSRPDVDAERIATLGMSMGSTLAWWAAALDERIKVCVDICCLTDFQALIDTGNLKGHGVYYFVPALLKHFTTAEINALIAPRPHLALAGNLDPLTPPEGLDRIDAELRKVYARHGKPGNWKLFRQDVAHVETAEMRREALGFLREHLG